MTENKGKKTPGRPPSNAKKQTIIRVRFDKSQYFILRHKAKMSGRNFSAFLREASENVSIRPRLTPEEKDFVRKLIGMANNLNQLAQKFNQAGLLRTVAQLEELRGKVDEVLKLLRDDQ